MPSQKFKQRNPRGGKPRRPQTAVPQPLGPEPAEAADVAPVALSTVNFPKIVLNANEDRRLRRGHLWVFSNEVASAAPDIAAGDLVHFHTHRDEFLGVGYYNPHSLIAGRLLDRRRAEIDRPFFENRLRRAWDLRQAVYPDGAYRWVFGESDDLPGLVIDRYGDAVVLESYAAGVDKLLPQVLEALETFADWKKIVVRNDVEVRKLEHVEMSVEAKRGDIEAPHEFECDGLKLVADLKTGQKTGFFFDQRENRKAVAAFAKGKRVLDLFCHTGAFGLACAQAGAAEVLGVDESEHALGLARQNAGLNGLSKALFEKADAFTWLDHKKEKFDVVVLDPPRFAASRKQLPQAIQAYVKLNALAMKRVTGGGFLASASCSQHVDRDTFRQILSRAAYESGRRVRLIHWGTQAKDHPVRLSMPETEYLKFAILQVS